MEEHVVSGRRAKEEVKIRFSGWKKSQHTSRNHVELNEDEPKRKSKSDLDDDELILISKMFNVCGVKEWNNFSRRTSNVQEIQDRKENS